MQGKDGWLFLDNDSSRVVKQHSGELKLSPDDLRRWQLLLESRIARLEKLGTPYLFMVAPDAHSVYPEMLPDRIERSAERPVFQLIDHLARAKSSASIIYPLEELMAEKRNGLVFSKTDSHWNEFGAFVAYDVLAEMLAPTIAIRRVTRRDVTFEPHMQAGDLGLKMEPPQASELLYAKIHSVPGARLVSDNRVENRGGRVVLRCLAAPESRCLMLGDSCSYVLMLFLAESFRRLVVGQTSSVDFDLVHEEKPSVVISLMTERFLLEVPQDSTELSIRELERSKRAQGRLRPTVAYSPAITSGGAGAEPGSMRSNGRPVTVGEVMATRFECVSETSTIRAAAERLLALGVNAITISDHENRCAGILTMRDVTEVVARGDDPETLTVRELSKPALSIPAEDPLEDAFALMKHLKQGWYPVVAEGRQLVGIIDRSHIIEYIRGIEAKAKSP